MSRSREHEPERVCSTCARVLDNKLEHPEYRVSQLPHIRGTPTEAPQE
jgi:hypothetical protein